MFLKLYVLDIAKINSRDMLDSYQPGDAILILKAVRTFHSGDVICFRFPNTDGKGGENCIQRLIGLPGDTLEIKDKKIFVNGIQFEETGNLRFNYFLRFIRKPDSLYFVRHHLTEGGIVSDNKDYSFTLNNVEADSLRRDSLVKTMEIKMEKHQVFNETVFPNSAVYAWNPDNLGKIYIPAKGDTIQLDTINVQLYESIITVFEKNKLYKQNDSIFINNEYQTKYVIQKDYFFVMGDNRDNAVDSRHFGFVPGNLIRGKVIKRLTGKRR